MNFLGATGARNFTGGGPPAPLPLESPLNRCIKSAFLRADVTEETTTTASRGQKRRSGSATETGSRNSNRKSSSSSDKMASKQQKLLATLEDAFPTALSVDDLARSSHTAVITLPAELSGAVYCNRSCLWVCLCVWVCYHDNSKLRASVFTKLGL